MFINLYNLFFSLHYLYNLVQTKYLCLPKLVCWNLTPNVMVFGGHEEGAFTNVISALIKELPESYFCSTMWEHSEKSVVYEPESRFSPDIKSGSGAFILDFLSWTSSRTVRNKVLLFLRHQSTVFITAALTD